MPYSVTTDLGLHYLSMSLKKDARILWVNPILVFVQVYEFCISLSWCYGLVYAL